MLQHSTQRPLFITLSFLTGVTLVFGGLFLLEQETFSRAVSLIPAEAAYAPGNNTAVAQGAALFFFLLLALIAAVPWVRALTPRASVFEQGVIALAIGAFGIPLSYILILAGGALLNLLSTEANAALADAYGFIVSENLLDAHMLISLSSLFVLGVLAWIVREILFPTHKNV